MSIDQGINHVKEHKVNAKQCGLYEEHHTVANSHAVCEQNIDGSSIDVPAPSFEGYRKHPKGIVRQWFWFCPDHVLHCHKVDKNIEPQPSHPPHVWPVHVGTNVTSDEVQTLLEGGYQVECITTNPSPATPRVCVSNEANTPNRCVQAAMAQGATQTTMQDGVRVQYRPSISNDVARKITLALAMKATVVEEISRAHGVHEVFKVESLGENGHVGLYSVSICKEPSCTCPDFTIVAKQKPYLACKHLYFVLLRVLGLSQNENMFIHQPIVNEADLFKALTQDRTYPSNDH